MVSSPFTYHSSFTLDAAGYNGLAVVSQNTYLTINNESWAICFYYLPFSAKQQRLFL